MYLITELGRRFIGVPIICGDMATKVIYFTIGGKPEQVEFRSEDSNEEVKG